ncbi:MAG: bifunctional diguanylate cyclase/phosphodiesterase [Clostridium sp.]|nr:bifunctional diguanylate cyclase/phosphodiesterase [Clostridium sp.]
MEGNLIFTRRLIEFAKDNLIVCDINNRTFRIHGNIANEFNDQKLNEVVISWDKAFKLIYKIDVKETEHKWLKLINSKEKINVEFRVKLSYKELLWFSAKFKPHYDENNNLEYYIGYIHDITREKYIEADIKKILEFDRLTKLPSKLYVREMVNDYVADCEKDKLRGLLLLLNVDNFKLINDSFGHQKGDKILEKVAYRIQEVVDEEDLICRYSGDEFIIFKPHIESVSKAEDYVIKIKKAFDDGFCLDDNNIFLTASIGVATFPDNGKDFDELLKNADTAMYRAKSNGKDEWEFFDNSISVEINRMYEIQRGLRTAIQDNELYVVFQPKVLLANSKVNGFEALLRWNSKTLGNVSPGEFIPIAESTRQIIPIGRYVLEEVFKKIKTLLEVGYNNFKVAVNFSEVQFRYGTIVNDFLELIDKYDVSSEYIEIEITESMLIKDFQNNIRRLKAIKQLGVSVALDDFGTGYSSLSYLTKLPIDVLKIDRSFVIDLIENSKSRCIVETIINLSHKLGIDVVAEGVEYAEQVEYLRGILCDVVQGYYYSKPVVFDEVKDMLGKELKK